MTSAPSRLGYFRWVICGLLLLGTTKNYMDRWVFSALKTTLQHDLGWNEIDYGNLVFAFYAAYAIGMLAVGRMLIAKIVGHVLQWTGSYMVPFFMAGSAYLLALAVIQLLTPNLEPAKID